MPHARRPCAGNAGVGHAWVVPSSGAPTLMKGERSRPVPLVALVAAPQGRMNGRSSDWADWHGSSDRGAGRPHSTCSVLAAPPRSSNSCADVLPPKAPGPVGGRSTMAGKRGGRPSAVAERALSSRLQGKVEHSQPPVSSSQSYGWNAGSQELTTCGAAGGARGETFQYA